MFQAKQSAAIHEKIIWSLLVEFSGHASFALIIAVAYFEWTIVRAVKFMSKTTNKDLKVLLKDVYGLRAYKALWKNEVVLTEGDLLLTEVITNWSAVVDAFKMRNIFVHGKDRGTRNMVEPKIESILRACSEIREYCEGKGYIFSKTLPVRKSKVIK